MPRLTITLEDQLHQALKETAARQRRSIDSIIEESLRLHGIRTHQSVMDIVSKARAAAGLEPDEALDLAVREVRELRRKQIA